MDEPVAVLLDTDIGYDIDDEWALAVCLLHPRINLLGVATVHSDTAARAVLARWLVEAAGKAVEVAAGEGDTLTSPLCAIVQAICQLSRLKTRHGWSGDGPMALPCSSRKRKRSKATNWCC